MNKNSILVVDDTPKNIQLLGQILSAEGYQLGFANNGQKALEALKNSHYDLVLLDVMMPIMDGYEACKKMKEDPTLKEIPVIFITAKTDSQSIVKGFETGGVDYVSKPFNNIELLARIRSHIELKHLKDQEIAQTQKEIIFTMGAIGETRSKETGNHVKRVAKYSKLLAILYGMSESEAELLKMASPMHDIGKVGIPDNILNKPGKFNADEWKIMKTHSQLGYDMLNHSKRPILKTASIVAIQHHEKFDGSGYPNGLSGNNIHIYGRITAVADVFDALGSDRVYKKSWELEKILDLLKSEKSKHFDPILIDLFLDNLDLFLEIRDKHKD